MARALLLALTCAAAASATSDVDYSGVKMPQYGNGMEYEMGHYPSPSHPSDDYHGYSPDVHASPDYKYEEESQSKTKKPSKDLDESDVWRKPGRKQKALVRPMESDDHVDNKYEPDDDEIPKFRTNRRHPKHRSRLKTEIDDRVEEKQLPRHHNKYNRDRKDIISDIDRKDYFNIDKEYVPDDKNKEFDDDVKFTTSKRPNRRRPRDKPMRRQGTKEEDYEEDLAHLDKVKGESESEAFHPLSNIRNQRPPELRKAVKHETYHKHLEDDDETSDDPMKVIPGKFKLKSYDDYDDYYDMKRVNKIKNKLPTLLRRTTVSGQPATHTGKNLMDELNNRRMMVPSPSPEVPETENPPHAPLNELPPSVHGFKTNSSKNLIDMNSEAIAANISLALQKAKEMSLAEKSRLSILKKAQRKEGQSFFSTKKPPVLLQVTSHMPTVVMVEPPSPASPWMRAKEMEMDTPDQLLLVKKLMRQKLVKEARNIHDLTDNWDEMICDYVDTSLLSDATNLTPTKCFAMLCLQLCVFVILS